MESSADDFDVCTSNSASVVVLVGSEIGFDYMVGYMPRFGEWARFRGRMCHTGTTSIMRR